MSITIAQMRAARGLLNWSQHQLAELAGISNTSIGQIESGSTLPRASTLAAIRSAFERGGIEFIGMDGVRAQSNFIKTYTGSTGFRDFMDHVYETAKTKGGDIVLFNANPVNWYKWLGEEWFNAHSKRMQALGDHINFKITSKPGENLFISSGFAEYRWFPEGQFTDRALYAYGDHLAFVNFEEKSVSVTVLTQPDFANAFKTLFNIAWDTVTERPADIKMSKVNA